MKGDPAVIQLEGLDLLVLSLFVLLVGEFLLARIAILRRYSIPSAVVGGITCSAILGGLSAVDLIRLNMGTDLRDLFLLVFFSAVGLTIKFQVLRENARAMLVLLALATGMLVFQNMVGSAIAAAFGYHPAAGLLAGSVTFMGGHGTGVAWSGIFQERFGILDAEQAALTLATLGLVAAGLTGGPLAEFLIRRHGLAETVESELKVPDLPEEPTVREGFRPSMLNTGIMAALCVYAAPLASDAVAGVGVTVPGFVFALLFGAVLTNLADLGRVDMNITANTLIRDISLQIFLAIAIVEMQFTFVASVAVPLLAIFVLQILLVLAFVYTTVFPVMGRNYESAVMCAGFTGFSLGSSLIGMGNMRAVTRKYGVAPAAFIIVPVVGSFLVDIVNSFIIQLYLLSPVLK